MMKRIIWFIVGFGCVIAMQGQIAGTYGINSPVKTYGELETLTPVHPSAPFINYGIGGWNTSQSFDPCVPDPNADPLVLLFSGMAAPAGSEIQNIGRATASRSAFLANPSTAWVMDPGNPTLTTGASGQPDSAYIRQSSCLINPDDGNKLYEYYTCNDGPVGSSSGTARMCLATSTDTGQTWTKLGAVMSAAIDGCSDETWVSQGAVLRLGTGSWVMVYSWRNASTVLPGIRAVTSTDGIHWVHGSCTNLLTVTPLYLEQHQIFMLNGQCVLLAEIGSNGFDWTIRSAVASSCTSNFTRGIRNPFIAGTGAQDKTKWDWNLVATPWYFVVNGQAYLLYCGTNMGNTNYNVNQYALGIATIPIPSFVIQ